MPEEFIKFDAILTMSAKHRKGIEEVKTVMRRILDEYAAQQLEAEKEEMKSRKG